MSNRCERRSCRDENCPWAFALFWGTVLNKESNKKAERCRCLIRALRSHFSRLKLLQFRDTQIRGRGKIVG